MKRRILVKTAPFHAFHWKKKRGSKQCRFERHHKPSSSPGHAENRGRRSIFPPIFLSFLSLPKPKKPTPLTCPFTDTTTPSRQKGHALQRQGRLCSIRPHACHHALPWEGRAGWPSLPLPINTEGVQDKKKGGEEGSWNVFIWKRKWGGPRERLTVIREKERWDRRSETSWKSKGPKVETREKTEETLRGKKGLERNKRHHQQTKTATKRKKRKGSTGE